MEKGSKGENNQVSSSPRTYGAPRYWQVHEDKGAKCVNDGDAEHKWGRFEEKFHSIWQLWS